MKRWLNVGWLDMSLQKVSGSHNMKTLQRQPRISHSDAAVLQLHRLCASVSTELCPNWLKAALKQFVCARCHIYIVVHMHS